MTTLIDADAGLALMKAMTGELTNDELDALEGDEFKAENKARFDARLEDFLADREGFRLTYEGVEYKVLGADNTIGFEKWTLEGGKVVFDWFVSR